MELSRAYHRGEAADFRVQAERLKREVSYHLRDRPMADADNWRLQNELGWHDDRGSLLRFLDDPSIEPTNNRAERALRGAVIARKVSHCSKNEEGADAFSAFTSVIRTLERNGDRPICGGSALRSFQRRPASLPITPNLPRHPLINYFNTIQRLLLLNMLRHLLAVPLDAVDVLLVVPTPDLGVHHDAPVLDGKLEWRAPVAGRLAERHGNL